MAMRMSGLMSGMDTESLIQQLVEARSSKVNKTKKAQTKLSWKQDAWKALNTKLKNLQTKFLSNMRFQSSYSKKTTKVSNESIVSVITGENAVNGVQTLEVRQLAKTGYLTGAELKGADGKTKGDYSALTTLGELGFSGEGTFSINTKNGSTDIKVDANTTISHVLNKMKEAGVNAAFDAKSQRFFVSSKESGELMDFSITASDADGDSALSAMGLKVNLANDAASLKRYEEYAKYYDASSKTNTLANMQSLIDSTVAARTNSYLEQYKSLQSSLKSAKDTIDEITGKYDSLGSAESYATQLEAKNASIKAIEDELAAGTLSADDAREKEKDLVELKKEAADLSTKKTDAETLASQREAVTNLTAQIADVEKYVTISSTTDAENNTTYSATAKGILVQEVEDSYYDKAKYASEVWDQYQADKAAGKATAGSGATKVNGQDAIIYLNDAEFTNNTNSFEINGLTLTAQSESKPGEKVTITTQNDTDGIYDMVKNFLKEYNAIINEIDKLYNADSAKGYEPLTEDEKAALSESEVEDYEKKIKDALFRHDDTLSSIRSGLTEVMASGVDVNGKTMYLHNFGIEKLAYFIAADNEKNAYHIAGDPDDGDTSGNADVLKGLIASDPDTVISFFSKLSQKLYAKMSDLSSSIDGQRSYGSFFYDKKMKKDYDNYTSKIAELEEKLNAYEDSWYKRFAKMETAMAKMQQNANAVTGMLGGK